MESQTATVSPPAQGRTVVPPHEREEGEKRKETFMAIQEIIIAWELVITEFRPFMITCHGKSAI